MDLLLAAINWKKYYSKQNLFKCSYKHLTVVQRQTWKIKRYSLRFCTRTSHRGWALEDLFNPPKSNQMNNNRTNFLFQLSEQCMSLKHLSPLKKMSKNVQQYCYVQKSINFLHNKSHKFTWCSHTQRAHKDAGTHTGIHTCTHTHRKDNHKGPVHTWPVYKNCAPQHACIHWGQGYSLEEESTVGQHVTMYSTVKQNKATGAELSQG